MRFFKDLCKEAIPFLRQIAQHAQDSGIHAEFPMLAASLFQKAMSAGYAREEVSALFKVLQK